MFQLTIGWPRHTESGEFVNPATNADYLDWLAQGNTPQAIATAPPSIVAQEQIDALERREQAPRFVRESLLEVAAHLAETRGAAQGLTKAQAMALLAAKNIGYVRLKELDDQIATLRAVVKGPQ